MLAFVLAAKIMSTHLIILNIRGITMHLPILFIVAIICIVASIYTFHRQHRTRVDYPRHSHTEHFKTVVPPIVQKCMQHPQRGWCVDRQGKGKCVPGFLDGPFDPGVHCANWWFQGMCLNGPLCRRTNVVPQASTARGVYHHPAPYYYRTIPWNDDGMRPAVRPTNE